MGTKLMVGQHLVVTVQDAAAKPIDVPVRKAIWTASDPKAITVTPSEDALSATIQANTQGTFSVTVEADIDAPDEVIQQFHGVLSIDVVEGDFRTVAPIEMGLTLDTNTAQLRAEGYRTAEYKAELDRDLAQERRDRHGKRIVNDGAGTHVVTDGSRTRNAFDEHIGYRQDERRVAKGDRRVTPRLEKREV